MKVFHDTMGNYSGLKSRRMKAYAKSKWVTVTAVAHRPITVYNGGNICLRTIASFRFRTNSVHLIILLNSFFIKSEQNFNNYVVLII